MPHYGSHDVARGETVIRSEQELAHAYDQARPRLVRVAYAILGSHGEAEDVVAEGWSRLVRHRRESIADVESWAVVAISRMSLDVLRSARVRREQYVGPWLPEPIVDLEAAVDPAERAALADEVSYALLVVLETLSPAERTVFVLHDLFAVPFPEVAQIVGRTPTVVRQLASRARRQVRDAQPRHASTREHRRVVEAFAVATESGDLTNLLHVLDPDVVLVTDGGGAVTAARRPVLGADRVARFVLGIFSKAPANSRVEEIQINGAAGFGIYDGDALATIVSLTVADGRVKRLDLIRAPDKLPGPDGCGLGERRVLPGGAP
jgi:RNA polymerase sigma-70 factor (ECF subfamily)